MRAIALVLIVMGTLPMAFVRPIIGLILWIGFSYMNPHRIAYGFATAFPWVMIVALVTMVSIAMNSRERQPMTFTAVTVLMLLFLLWTALSTLFAVRGDLAPAELSEFFKILLMAFATMMLVTDPRRMHWVIWSIVLSFGFWGFKGGVFTILSGGGYHVMGPIKSFFRDNNGFALVMCMTLPLIRYLQMQEPNRWLRRGLGVLMALTVVAIVGTYSRGGFLALAAVGFMLILKSRRRAGLIVLVAILAGGVATFMPAKYFGRMDTINTSAYKEDNSASGRIDSWKFATNVALAEPLFGGGFDVWASDEMWNRHGPPGAKHRAIHSIFFQVLGEHGFVGFSLFLAMGLTGYLALARIRKQARAGPPESQWMGDLASMIQVSLAGFVAAGAFLPMPYFDLLYQLLAITAVLQVFAARIAHAPAQAQVAEPSATPAKNPSVGGLNRPKPQPMPPAANRPNGGGGGTRDLPWW